MLISVSLVTFCLIQVATSSSRSTSPLVKTSWGLVQGKYIQIDQSHRVAAFLGIPYALAPVGPLRYSRTASLIGLPNHHKHRHHHHDLNRPIKADSFKPACIQKPFGHERHAGNISLSENCLYLNIFTPAHSDHKSILPNQLRPVFVYIHGSAFVFGGPASVHNQVEYLTAYGDIMVVTVAHRLGFLGIAYGGSVDEGENQASTGVQHPLAGNQNLHDVIQSLKWVHDNIRYFGGDPDRVTLSGLSAGSVIATALFVSPQVPDGLFNKVVAMSGLSIYPSSISSNHLVKSITVNTSQAVNCSKQFDGNDNLGKPFDWFEVNCLKRVSPFALEETQLELIYNPMFGDDILPQSPQQLVSLSNLKRKNYSLLIGTEQNEDVSGFTPKTVDQAIDWFNNKFNQQRGSSENFDNFTNLIKSYFNELPDDQITNVSAIEATFHQMLSDYNFICPSLLMGKAFASSNQVYFYRNFFIFDKDKDKRPFGTAHADDAGLFIGYPFSDPGSYSDLDREVSLKMMKLLGSFVNDGYVPWPAVESQNGQMIPHVWQITSEVDYTNVEVDSYSERCSRWAAIFSIDDL